MDIKIKDNSVSYFMKAGKDFVHNTMDANSANKIIKNGKMTTSKKFDGYNLCIDGIYYFETVASNCDKPKNTKQHKETINTSSL